MKLQETKDSLEACQSASSEQLRAKDTHIEELQKGFDRYEKENEVNFSDSCMLGYEVYLFCLGLDHCKI